MLCYLHHGRLLAQQPSTSSSSAPASDPVEEAIIEGRKLRDSGHNNEALASLTRAVSLARQRNDVPGEAKSLIVLGSIQKAQFRYSAALESIQKGREIADRLQNRRLSGAALGSMSDMYSQVGDLAAAEATASHAISTFQQIPKPEQRDQMLLARAFLAHAGICFKQGRNEEAYRDSDSALSISRATNDVALQVMIFALRGSNLVLEDKIGPANESLQQANSLAIKLHDEEHLAFIKEYLAELELRKPRPDSKLALRLIDEAFAGHSASFAASPQYYPIDIRGRILLASGNKSGALAEFLRAVNAAGRWRAGALPGDITSSQTVAELQGVYGDYVQLASEIALDKNDNGLAVNALEVLAENRAASLREQLRRVYTSHFRMPDEYYRKLAELQSAQAAVTLGRNAGEDKAQLEDIRLEISNLENQIGIKPQKFREQGEKFSRQNSLRDIQRTLNRDQVLVSITLGRRRSYIWAVTGQKVSLSSLPREEELTSKARLFAANVRNNRGAAANAADLSGALFQGLPADIWNRSEWMMVADGPLLSGIPFSALTNLRTNKRLIDSINIRFLPSELLLLDKPGNEHLPTHFIGVADPIYNQADARLVRTRYADAKSISTSAGLARLAGSDREIRSAAEASHAATAVLLTAGQATRDNLHAAFAQTPTVVHFAVHVVSPPNEPEQAALALSLKSGLPELLTPEVVASFHTPGSLIVLSGCSSGQGKVMPGAGLMGLGRAWLMAGAAAVVVSNWPTPDDSGRFFAAFYRHFEQTQRGDAAQRAAQALREAQLDMLNGSGYQTASSFWGAFSVIAKE